MQLQMSLPNWLNDLTSIQTYYKFPWIMQTISKIIVIINNEKTRWHVTNSIECVIRVSVHFIPILLSSI